MREVSDVDAAPTLGFPIHAPTSAVNSTVAPLTTGTYCSAAAGEGESGSVTGQKNRASHTPHSPPAARGFPPRYWEVGTGMTRFFSLVNVRTQPAVARVAQRANPLFVDMSPVMRAYLH